MMNSVETANGSRSVGESVGRRVGRVDQRYKKAKPQPNHTACATVRNWRNWTIIIKYHHFVTIKGIWKFFCFFSPHIRSSSSSLMSSSFFSPRYSIETVEQIRVE